MYQKQKKGHIMYNNHKLIKYSIIAIILIILIYSSTFSINQGERGVVLTFGQISKIAEPGLGFKIPLISQIKKISVRTKKLYGGSTEYNKIYVPTFAIYSSDIQAADVQMSINYSINPAFIAEIYTKYSLDIENSIIAPQLLAKAKDAFGNKTAVDTIRSRDGLAKIIMDGLQQQFLNTGINIESIQIENIDFSSEYEKSVEERMKAEVEVTKVKQNLEREKINADMVRTKAKGEADAKIITAEADAQTIKLLSIAEAESIKIKTASLAASPAFIELVKAEKWDGKLPSTMLPNQTIPIINSNTN